MGVGALIFNPLRDILIVKPTYTAGWSVPGGVIDQDESPRAACIREVREELGLVMPVQELLCVDYYPDDGLKGESLQFIFYGGVLDEATATCIRVDGREIAEYRFAPVDDALDDVPGKLRKRLRHSLTALADSRTVYLESGKLPY